MRNIGFQQSAHDPCYFYRWNGECFSDMVIWVDDFYGGSDDANIAADIRQQLVDQYDLVDVTTGLWLGMHIEHNKDQGRLTISMRKSIEEMLEEFQLQDSKSVPTPADPKAKLIKAESGSFDIEASQFDYRGAVGRLLWIARTGRPDILYAVSQLGQFSHNWNMKHVVAAKRVMRYLNGTKDLKLVFHQGESFELRCFADADFANEPEENDYPMRSISGIVAYIHGVGPIYSSATLEKTLSLSTAEAEYKCTSKAARLCSGFREFLNEIGFVQDEPTIIYNDNQAAVAMVKQRFSSGRTRHVKIQFRHIREKIENREIEVRYLLTEKMIADLMTKALDKIQFQTLRDLLMNGVGIAAEYL